MATSTTTLEGPETRDNAAPPVRQMPASLAKAEHVREEVIDRTRREPVKALTAAFGVGVAMGALLGWTWHRPTTKH